MRKKSAILSLLISSLLMFSSCSPAEEMPEEMYNRVPTEQAEAVRPELKDDFYGYANFDFISDSQIPYGSSSYSRDDLAMDKVKEKMTEIVHKCASKDQKRGSKEQKIKDLYEQYKDKETRSAVGIAPLADIVQQIESVQTIDEYVKVVAALYCDYGVDTFFYPRVLSDYYDSSRYMFVFYPLSYAGMGSDAMKKSSDSVDKIGDAAETALKYLGTDKAEARKRAEDVASMAYETAKPAMSQHDLTYDIERTYNVYDKKKLSEIYSNVNIDQLFNDFGLTCDSVVVLDIEQSKKINEYLTSEHLRTLKDYALTMLTRLYASELPDFDTDEVALSYDEDKDAVDLVYYDLINDIDVLFANEICTEKNTAAAKKIAKDICSSLGQLIDNSERLSDDGKNKLHQKLDNVIFLIGVDEKEGSDFDIVPAEEGGNLLANAVTIKRNKIQSNLKMYGQKVDRYEWQMHQSEVNACYSPYLNNISIPAAQLITGFDADDPYIKQLCDVGFVLAHELNHAFDANCINFDDKANYNKDWLSEEDKQAYQEVLDKAEKYFESYHLLGVYSVNGKTTLGENVADLAAMECILNLLDDEEEIKQFFTKYAESWGAVESVSSVISQITTDEHSPNEIRVNTLLSDSEKFYQVYDIKETDKMYVAPEKRVKVW